MPTDAETRIKALEDAVLDLVQLVERLAEASAKTE